jgi:hypothetical protein
MFNVWTEMSYAKLHCEMASFVQNTKELVVAYILVEISPKTVLEKTE